MNEPKEEFNLPNPQLTRRGFLIGLGGLAALPVVKSALEVTTAYANAADLLESKEQQENPIKIVVLGDSNSEDGDAAYIVNRDPDGADDLSYVQRLPEKLPFDCEITNLSLGATRVTQDGHYTDTNELANSTEFLTEEKIRMLKDMGKIDTLVFALGTGDAIEMINNELFIDNMIDFFATLLKSGCSWENLIIVLPPNLDTIQLADGRYFVSEESVQLVARYRNDIKRTFSGFANFVDPTQINGEYLQRINQDNIHLNNIGQEEIANMLARTLKRLYPFEKTKSPKRRKIFGKNLEA